MVLSDLENCAVGLLCGTADVCLLQPTNYWKNAQQNGMPFSLSPAVLYRGISANILNNGFCVMSQFFLNGVVKKLMLGDAVRELSNAEKIGAGVTAGALSGVVCGPIELIMIQQQAKGGGLLETAIKMAQAGPSTFFRGTLAMMAREGIYAGSFLGMMPVMREQFRQMYPDSIGKTEDSARFSAAFLCAPIGGMLSHPPDTVKTCMQGDIEGLKYKGYTATANAVIKERGMSALWAGYPWRCFRQLVALVMFDKIQSELVPKLFPHAFAPVAPKEGETLTPKR